MLYNVIWYPLKKKFSLLISVLGGTRIPMKTLLSREFYSVTATGRHPLEKTCRSTTRSGVPRSRFTQEQTPPSPPRHEKDPPSPDVATEPGPPGGRPAAAAGARTGAGAAQALGRGAAPPPRHRIHTRRSRTQAGRPRPPGPRPLSPTCPRGPRDASDGGRAAAAGKKKKKKKPTKLSGRPRSKAEAPHPPSRRPGAGRRG